MDEKKKIIKIFEDGQEEEFKHNWRNWIQRKISSEKSDTKRPKWLQLLSAHNAEEDKRRTSSTSQPEVTADHIHNVNQPQWTEVFDSEPNSPTAKSSKSKEGFAFMDHLPRNKLSSTNSNSDEYYRYCPYTHKPANKSNDFRDKKWTNLFENGIYLNDIDSKSLKSKDESVDESLAEGDRFSDHLSRRSSWSEKNFEDLADDKENVKWMKMHDLRMVEDEVEVKSNKKEKAPTWNLQLKDVVTALACDKDLVPQFEGSDSFDKEFLKPALRYNAYPSWGPTSGLGFVNDIEEDFSKVPKSRFDDKYSDYYGSYGKRSSLGSTVSSKSIDNNLRRRNTIVVILMAIAVLAALSVIVGIALYFTYHKAILRAHITLTIDNRNFTEAMTNENSEDWNSIAEPMCEEMDRYFLLSEYMNYYLKCEIKRMSDDEGKVGLYFTLDFLDNIYTRNAKNIEQLIIRKAGRLVRDAKLFLVIRDFLIYIKSLDIWVETILITEDVTHPDRPKDPEGQTGFGKRSSKLNPSVVSVFESSILSHDSLPSFTVASSWSRNVMFDSSSDNSLWFRDLSSTSKTLPSSAANLLPSDVLSSSIMFDNVHKSFASFATLSDQIAKGRSAYYNSNRPLLTLAYAKDLEQTRESIVPTMVLSEFQMMQTPKIEDISIGYSQILESSVIMNTYENSNKNISENSNGNSLRSHIQRGTNMSISGITGSVFGFTGVLNDSLVDGSDTPLSSFLVTESSTKAKEFIDYWKAILNEFASTDKNSPLFISEETNSVEQLSRDLQNHTDSHNVILSNPLNNDSNFSNIHPTSSMGQDNHWNDSPKGIKLQDENARHNKTKHNALNTSDYIYEQYRGFNVSAEESVKLTLTQTENGFKTSKQDDGIQKDLSANISNSSEVFQTYDYIKENVNSKQYETQQLNNDVKDNFSHNGTPSSLKSNTSDIMDDKQAQRQVTVGTSNNTYSFVNKTNLKSRRGDKSANIDGSTADSEMNKGSAALISTDNTRENSNTSSSIIDEDHNAYNTSTSYNREEFNSSDTLNATKHFTDHENRTTTLFKNAFITKQVLNISDKFDDELNLSLDRSNGTLVAASPIHLNDSVLSNFTNDFDNRNSLYNYKDDNMESSTPNTSNLSNDLLSGNSLNGIEYHTTNISDMNKNDGIHVKRDKNKHMNTTDLPNDSRVINSSDTLQEKSTDTDDIQVVDTGHKIDGRHDLKTFDDIHSSKIIQSTENVQGDTPLNSSATSGINRSDNVNINNNVTEFRGPNISVHLDDHNVSNTSTSYNRQEELTLSDTLNATTYYTTPETPHNRNTRNQTADSVQNANKESNISNLSLDAKEANTVNKTYSRKNGNERGFNDTKTFITKQRINSSDSFDDVKNLYHDRSNGRIVMSSSIHLNDSVLIASTDNLVNGNSSDKYNDKNNTDSPSPKTENASNDLFSSNFVDGIDYHTPNISNMNIADKLDKKMDLITTDLPNDNKEINTSNTLEDNNGLTNISNFHLINQNLTTSENIDKVKHWNSGGEEKTVRNSSVNTDDITRMDKTHNNDDRNHLKPLDGANSSQIMHSSENVQGDKFLNPSPISDTNGADGFNMTNNSTEFSRLNALESLYNTIKSNNTIDENNTEKQASTTASNTIIMTNSHNTSEDNATLNTFTTVDGKDNSSNNGTTNILKSNSSDIIDDQQETQSGVAVEISKNTHGAKGMNTLYSFNKTNLKSPVGNNSTNPDGSTADSEINNGSAPLSSTDNISDNNTSSGINYEDHNVLNTSTSYNREELALSETLNATKHYTAHETPYNRNTENLTANSIQNASKESNISNLSPDAKGGKTVNKIYSRKNKNERDFNDNGDFITNQRTNSSDTFDDEKNLYHDGNNGTIIMAPSIHLNDSVFIDFTNNLVSRNSSGKYIDGNNMESTSPRTGKTSNDLFLSNSVDGIDHHTPNISDMNENASISDKLDKNKNLNTSDLPNDNKEITTFNTLEETKGLRNLSKFHLINQNLTTSENIDKDKDRNSGVEEKTVRNSSVNTDRITRMDKTHNTDDRNDLRTLDDVNSSQIMRSAENVQDDNLLNSSPISDINRSHDFNMTDNSTELSGLNALESLYNTVKSKNGRDENNTEKQASTAASNTITMTNAHNTSEDSATLNTFTTVEGKDNSSNNGTTNILKSNSSDIIDDQQEAQSGVAVETSNNTHGAKGMNTLYSFNKTNLKSPVGNNSADTDGSTADSEINNGSAPLSSIENISDNNTSSGINYEDHNVVNASTSYNREEELASSDTLNATKHYTAHETPYNRNTENQTANSIQNASKESNISNLSPDAKGGKTVNKIYSRKNKNERDFNDNGDFITNQRINSSDTFDDEKNLYHDGNNGTIIMAPSIHLNDSVFIDFTNNLVSRNSSGKYTDGNNMESTSPRTENTSNGLFLSNSVDGIDHHTPNISDMNENASISDKLDKNKNLNTSDLPNDNKEIKTFNTLEETKGLGNLSKFHLINQNLTTSENIDKDKDRNSGGEEKTVRNSSVNTDHITRMDKTHNTDDRNDLKTLDGANSSQIMSSYENVQGENSSPISDTNGADGFNMTNNSTEFSRLNALESLYNTIKSNNTRDENNTDKQTSTTTSNTITMTNLHNTSEENATLNTFTTVDGKDNSSNNGTTNILKSNSSDIIDDQQEAQSGVAVETSNNTYGAKGMNTLYSFNKTNLKSPVGNNSADTDGSTADSEINNGSAPLSSIENISDNNTSSGINYEDHNVLNASTSYNREEELASSDTLNATKHYTAHETPYNRNTENQTANSIQNVSKESNISNLSPDAKGGKTVNKIYSRKNKNERDFNDNGDFITNQRINSSDTFDDEKNLYHDGNNGTIIMAPSIHLNDSVFIDFTNNLVSRNSSGKYTDGNNMESTSPRTENTSNDLFLSNSVDGIDHHTPNISDMNENASISDKLDKNKNLNTSDLPNDNKEIKTFNTLEETKGLGNLSKFHLINQNLTTSENIDKDKDRNSGGEEKTVRNSSVNTDHITRMDKTHNTDDRNDLKTLDGANSSQIMSSYENVQGENSSPISDTNGADGFNMTNNSTEFSRLNALESLYNTIKSNNTRDENNTDKQTSTTTSNTITMTNLHNTSEENATLNTFTTVEGKNNFSNNGTTNILKSNSSDIIDDQQEAQSEAAVETSNNTYGDKGMNTLYSFNKTNLKSPVGNNSANTDGSTADSEINNGSAPLSSIENISDNNTSSGINYEDHNVVNASTSYNREEELASSDTLNATKHYTAHETPYNRNTENQTANSIQNASKESNISNLSPDAKGGKTVNKIYSRKNKNESDFNDNGDFTTNQRINSSDTFDDEKNLYHDGNNGTIIMAPSIHLNDSVFIDFTNNLVSRNSSGKYIDGNNMEFTSPRTGNTSNDLFLSNSVDGIDHHTPNISDMNENASISDKLDKNKNLNTSDLPNDNKEIKTFSTLEETKGLRNLSKFHLINQNLTTSENIDKDKDRNSGVEEKTVRNSSVNTDHITRMDKTHNTDDRNDLRTLDDVNSSQIIRSVENVQDDNLLNSSPISDINRSDGFNMTDNTTELSGLNVLVSVYNTVKSNNRRDENNTEKQASTTASNMITLTNTPNTSEDNTTLNTFTTVDGKDNSSNNGTTNLKSNAYDIIDDQQGPQRQVAVETSDKGMNTLYSFVNKTDFKSPVGDNSARNDGGIADSELNNGSTALISTNNISDKNTPSSINYDDNNVVNTSTTFNKNIENRTATSFKNAFITKQALNTSETFDDEKNLNPDRSNDTFVAASSFHFNNSVFPDFTNNGNSSYKDTDGNNMDLSTPNTANASNGIRSSNLLDGINDHTPNISDVNKKLGIDDKLHKNKFMNTTGLSNDNKEINSSDILEENKGLRNINDFGLINQSLPSSGNINKGKHWNSSSRVDEKTHMNSSVDTDDTEIVDKAHHIDGGHDLKNSKPSNSSAISDINRSDNAIINTNVTEFEGSNTSVHLDDSANPNKTRDGNSNEKETSTTVSNLIMTNLPNISDDNFNTNRTVSNFSSNSSDMMDDQQERTTGLYDNANGDENMQTYSRNDSKTGNITGTTDNSNKGDVGLHSTGYIKGSDSSNINNYDDSNFLNNSSRFSGNNGSNSQNHMKNYTASKTPYNLHSNGFTRKGSNISYDNAGRKNLNSTEGILKDGLLDSSKFSSQNITSDAATNTSISDNITKGLNTPTSHSSNKNISSSNSSRLRTSDNNEDLTTNANHDAGGGLNYSVNNTVVDSVNTPDINKELLSPKTMHDGKEFNTSDIINFDDAKKDKAGTSNVISGNNYFKSNKDLNSTNVEMNYELKASNKYNVGNISTSQHGNGVNNHDDSQYVYNVSSVNGITGLKMIGDDGNTNINSFDNVFANESIYRRVYPNELNDSKVINASETLTIDDDLKSSVSTRLNFSARELLKDQLDNKTLNISFDLDDTKSMNLRFNQNYSTDFTHRFELDLSEVLSTPATVKSSERSNFTDNMYEKAPSNVSATDESNTISNANESSHEGGNSSYNFGKYGGINNINAMSQRLNNEMDDSDMRSGLHNKSLLNTSTYEGSDDTTTTTMTTTSTTTTPSTTTTTLPSTTTTPTTTTTTPTTTTTTPTTTTTTSTSTTTTSTTTTTTPTTTTTTPTTTTTTPTTTTTTLTTTTTTPTTTTTTPTTTTPTTTTTTPTTTTTTTPTTTTPTSTTTTPTTTTTTPTTTTTTPTTTTTTPTTTTTTPTTTTTTTPTTTTTTPTTTTTTPTTTTTTTPTTTTTTPTTTTTTPTTTTTTPTTTTTTPTTTTTTATTTTEMPKGLFFTGDEGFRGERRVTAKCHIENFTEWESLTISKGGRDLIRLSKNGKIQSGLGRSVMVKKVLKEYYAGIAFRFRRLQCSSEGTYTCAVDREYPKDAEIIVKTPPYNKPKLSLSGEIFGERKTVFTCSGNPGYPNGQLGWKVKFKNDKTFRDWVFHSAERVVTDKDCRRHEVVNVTFLFTMKWNGAKLRCQAPGSNQYHEVDIWLISENICDRAPLFGKIAHPYTCRKFITCMEDRLLSSFCPGSLCFDEATEQCVTEDQPSAGDEFSCVGKANAAIIPDSMDCKKYHICYNGENISRECGHRYFAGSAPPYCVEDYHDSYCAKHQRSIH